jgi:hypothetical protein
MESLLKGEVAKKGKDAKIFIEELEIAAAKLEKAKQQHAPKPVLPREAWCYVHEAVSIS